jgi:hypothetical protein
MNAHFDIHRKIRYRMLSEMHTVIAEMYADSAYYGAIEEIQNSRNAYERCLNAFYAFYIKPEDRKATDGAPIDEFGASVEVQGGE